MRKHRFRGTKRNRRKTSGCSDQDCGIINVYFRIYIIIYMNNDVAGLICKLMTSVHIRYRRHRYNCGKISQYNLGIHIPFSLYPSSPGIAISPWRCRRGRAGIEYCGNAPIRSQKTQHVLSLYQYVGRHLCAISQIWWFWFIDTRILA